MRGARTLTDNFFVDDNKITTKIHISKDIYLDIYISIYHWLTLNNWKRRKYFYLPRLSTQYFILFSWSLMIFSSSDLRYQLTRASFLPISLFTPVQHRDLGHFGVKSIHYSIGNIFCYYK